MIVQLDSKAKERGRRNEHLLKNLRKIRGWIYFYFHYNADQENDAFVFDIHIFR